MTVTGRAGAPGFGFSRTPFANSLAASQWIAAITFSVSSGWRRNAAPSSPSVMSRRSPENVAAMIGARSEPRPRIAVVTRSPGAASRKS